MPRSLDTGKSGKLISHGSVLRLGGATVSCLLLLFTGVCGLAGCRYSDYFTETIVDQRAAQEGETDPIVINSLTAETRTDKLSARRWDESSEQTSPKENIVVYGSKPNDTHETPHSVFSTSLKAWSFEASDPVRLIYSESAELDHEVEIDEDEKTTAKDTESKTSGGVKSKKENSDQENVAQEQKSSQDDSDKNASEAKVKKDDKNPSSEKSDADNDSKGGSKASGEGDSSDDGSGGGSSASGDGTGDSGSGGNGGGGTGDSEDDGKQEEESGGYDGNVKVYDPNTSRSVLNTCDRIAATGQAAVVVQAIGGEGALCAMDMGTYYGLGDDGKDEWQAGSFSAVFSDEVCGLDGTEGVSAFENDCLLWTGDGSSSSDVTDIDALVKACGENGVILFDQSVAGYEQRFSNAQLAKIEKAGIQLVPIELGTVDGMKAAASAVGEILGESDRKVGEHSSSEMAELYCQEIDAVVTGVLGTHSGGLASPGGENKNEIVTDYSDFPLSKSFVNYGVYGLVCQDYAGSVSYSNEDASYDVSDGILFAYDNWESSSSYFWLQTAGVCEQISSGNCSGDRLRIVWGEQSGNYSLSCFSGYTSPAFAKAVDGPSEAAVFKLCGASKMVGSDRKICYFGCDQMPYVIVKGSSDNDYNGSEVKDAFVRSVRKSGTPYSCLTTTVGMTMDGANAFSSGRVSVADSVLVNPVGLLGDWASSGGSMESVLESVWLAEVYSKAPSNSGYDPSFIYDDDGISDLSVKIDGNTYTTPHEVIGAFYKTFYRYDIDSSRAKADGCSYSDIVPDEGVEG